ncbi:hypothetical protein [Burkholderia thailandensis]|uniref:hypothetical protein n=1 Tax=Burkholderia thailandensis TaxID=57975 RepID=UPI0003EC72C9|nr:hypothetical protein [Burkholderia thailandensis]AHI64094.1 hypothetical protein BTL_1316 [Burkholderia thailandensis H0587]
MKRILVSALLALSSLAFGATLAPIQLLNPAGSTSGQAIVSTGPSTAPAWGSIGAGSLSPIGANSVLANATGATASPTAVAMPSCSGTNNALRWTAGTGFTCASSIALTSSGLNQFASTTSAQLAGIISDETGSGSLVFATNPTIAGASFSAGLGLSYSNPAFTLNDTSGTNSSALIFNKSGSTAWVLLNSSPTNALLLSRYVSGSLVDNPIAVSNSTGIVTFADGVAASGAINANARLFVSDSTNQATTLGITNTGTNGANILLAGNGATTPNKSIRSNGGNLQFCNSAYSACPVTITDAGNISSVGGIDNTSIGATTPAAGTFTTLKGNSLAHVKANNTSGQSIPNSAYTTVTGWTTTFDANSNFNASTGTFTAPATAYYRVSCQLAWGALTTSPSNVLAAGLFIGASGAPDSAGFAPAAASTSTNFVAGNATLSLAAGNTVTCRAFQNSGSAAALSTAAPQVQISVDQLP